LKRFQATPARTAWDHFIPGQAAARGGDLKEGIRLYEAALVLQPNHYDSLFCLAERLRTEQIKRVPEAVQLYRACSALRQNDQMPHRERGDCLVELGRMEEAEAAYTSAIAAAPRDGITSPLLFRA